VRFAELATKARGRFWRFAPEEGRVLHERSVRAFTYTDGRLDEVDPRLRPFFEQRSSEFITEYLVELDDVVIEPSWGWVVRGVNGLVQRTVPYGHRWHGPHVGRYFVKRALYGRRPQRFDAVVSFREKYETYYWHLFDDLLPRLFILDAQGIDPELPIVVSGTVFRRPYFQEVLARTGLDRRTWVVQDGTQHIGARRAYFCRPLRAWPEYFDGVLRLLGVPVDGSGEGTRLFVTRRGHFRTLVNLDEIERIAAGAGYEVVDPGELSVDEQIRIFAGARKVAGVHGGGLTNVIFRGRRELDLLELVSPTWPEPWFFWVACMYGHGYRALVGDTVAGHEFHVSPAEFERELQALDTS
jgi:capsular polysaccharide biosynthesis protein